MNWLSKLERKYGRYGIPNLMAYIVALYGAGFVLDMANPSFYGTYLSLDMGAVFQGQLWRVLTFIIAPPSTSPLWVFVSLMLYYSLGKHLEMAWGTFRFNLYFFAGVLFHVLAALIIYLFTGLSLQLDTYYLNLSLFLVFAALYPDMQFLLFFVIPVKAKWLAWLDIAFVAYAVLQAFLPAYGGGPYGLVYKANALAAVVSLLNFFIFFFGSRNRKPYMPKQVKRKKEFRRDMKRGGNAPRYVGGARHRCTVCGRTELDDPKLEFRYCSKCNGNYEYCQDHLFTHTHVK